jgi:hypothetical protein
VATFNGNYNPPNPAGLPSFVAVGPTQFYASALIPPGLPNAGDLLIAGDVGIPAIGQPPLPMADTWLNSIASTPVVW